MKPEKKRRFKKAEAPKKEADTPEKGKFKRPTVAGMMSKMHGYKKGKE